MFRRFWIDHPFCANPVGPIRYVAYHVGDFVERWGGRLANWAIDPHNDDPIPF